LWVADFQRNREFVFNNRQSAIDNQK